MSKLTHFGAQGQAHMVDVAAKDETHRVARAVGCIRMLPATLRLIASGSARKGDVLGIARIAAIQAARPDAVFNALHGRFGEDGAIQGVLDWLGIPYTHSGVRASALAMDKSAAKAVFAAAGLPVARGREVTVEELAADDPLPLPYVVKPVSEGSSVGVEIVRAGDNRRVEKIGRAHV